MTIRYETAQQVVNDMAKVKMAMNSHKGKIEDQHSRSLIGKLKVEVEELEKAMGEDDLMHIIEEAADVQNFLLAIVHQQIEKYRNRK